MSEELSDSDELIAIGQVGKPRGIHGEAFLKPLTDFPERFESIRDVTVEDPEGNRSVMRVERVRTYGSRLAVKSFMELGVAARLAKGHRARSASSRMAMPATWVGHNEGVQGPDEGEVGDDG